MEVPRHEVNVLSPSQMEASRLTLPNTIDGT